MGDKLFIAYMIGKLEGILDRIGGVDCGVGVDEFKRMVAELTELKLRAQQEIGFDPELETEEDE